LFLCVQVLTYHLHACESAGESLVELVDYCARKVAVLNSGRLQRELESSPGAVMIPDSGRAAGRRDPKQLAEELTRLTPRDELTAQAAQLQFQVAVTAVGVLRFLCGHVESLPLAVLHRLLDTHDVLMGVIPLIENPPWARRREGRWEKLVDLKWARVEPAELLRVTKHEGQAWLALYHLLCSGEVRRRYHFNSFRKGQLLRVRKYLNDVMLDQLPVLADVQRFMDELAVAEVPEPTAGPGSFLLEQVSQSVSQSGAGARVLLRRVHTCVCVQVAAVRESILKGKDVAEVAKQQLATVFSGSDANDRDLKRLADIYTSDWVDEAAGEAKCAKCGKEATQKCSRCGLDWYCSRECQASGCGSAVQAGVAVGGVRRAHSVVCVYACLCAPLQVQQWKAHKPVCDVVSKSRPTAS
jgi:hypothetical protein